MTIISSYSIGPSLASSNAADENDARHKREAKRKLVNEPPLMRQADRKNSEKVLSEAMQLASYKTQRQSILNKDAHKLTKSALEFIDAGFDSKHSVVIPEFAFPNERSEQTTKATPFALSKDEKPLSLADLSKNLHKIEFTLVENFRRADLSEFLVSLENFIFQLNTAKQNPELNPKKNINAESPDQDIDSMKCSIDFIEGYCEASSISEEIKQKISDELSRVKILLNPGESLDVPVKLPDSAIEAIALQVATENVQKSLGSKASFNEYKANAVSRKEEKNREDSLPLATLRSI